jgi:8-oxo-dGTP pyrophosphatase MutT (NUDIX family)
MSDFADSYLGRLRAAVGSRLLMVFGSRIIVERGDGRLLMQHRRDLGIWGFLGGYVEPEESMDDCVAREVLEETGMEIRNPVPYAFSADPRLETITYPNGDRCQSYVLMYWTREFSGEPKILDDESLALDWFDRSNLPPMSPTMIEGLKAYYRYRESGNFQLI